jgi:hypothetical protein
MTNETLATLSSALQIAAVAEQRDDGTAEVPWNLIERLRDRLDEMGVIWKELGPLLKVVAPSAEGETHE